MKLLLDTHILLWWFLGSDQLSQAAQEWIEDTENEIFYSIISILEVQLTFLSHPDKIDFSADTILAYCKMSNFSRIDLSEHHIRYLEKLCRPVSAPPHKDPFDRLLICQAATEGMKFLTHDHLIVQYDEPCIVYV